MNSNSCIILSLKVWKWTRKGHTRHSFIIFTKEKDFFTLLLNFKYKAKFKFSFAPLTGRLLLFRKCIICKKMWKFVLVPVGENIELHSRKPLAQTASVA
jgi:hypothetical protein